MVQMTTCDLHNETIVKLQRELERLQAENAKLRVRIAEVLRDESRELNAKIHAEDALIKIRAEITSMRIDDAALRLENAKLRKHAEAMAECKALADGMANMIRGFIFKTVERETLDEMAAKYRKWEEDYCHRNGA